MLFLRSGGELDAENDLWAVHAGEDPIVLFGADAEGELTAAERARRERAREQAGGVVTYSAREDCSEVVLQHGGCLHVLDVASGEGRVLPAVDEIFDPRFRPDSDAVAYVSGRGLRVSDADGDRALPGTFDDSETVSWGSAEFVAAEEMGRSRGFWWAPSGGAMVATRVDTSGVDQWWIASPESPATDPRAIRYPGAGCPNAAVDLWLLDPSAGPYAEIDWRRGEFEYLADVRWGKRLLCSVQPRDQRATVILEVDPKTGSTTEIDRTTDEHWVELMPNTPSDTDRGLVMVADRDGMRRLVVDGAPVDLDAQVRMFVGEHEGALLATVTTDATDSVLVRVDTSGETTILTDPGTYASAVHGGGTLAISTATVDGPTTHQVRWADGSVTPIESFAAEPGFICTPSFHVVGDRALNATLNLPAGHDGSPLPVLLDPYGGPHAQRVVRSRNAFATSQWFAEQGFAVVVIDGRGTPGRGPAFEREVWGDLAQPVLDDQIDGLHALAAERSELDLSRVGIRGWSFGGYLAALAVLRRPDAFHAAVAGAPVTDWLLYDTHYTERYLGHPGEHPAHYEQTSLIVDAHRLERPLMLIHGLDDDNVVAAHTLTLSRALLEAGRAHEVLPLSGVSHMTPQERVAENLLRFQVDFLKRSLDVDS
ncbi:MAG: prolyl oligopeptidase family serine peptidase [Acidimicrobiales bacterium]